MRPITILVLSYDDCAEYTELMNAQKNTWDSVEEPYCKTIYYRGNGKQQDRADVKVIHPWSIEYAYPVSDHYYEMHWKFALCLKHLSLFPIPQFVFRTNSSSYINKKLLRTFVDSLPDEKVYAGWTGSDFVSGAGFVISPDVQKILIDELREGRRMEEDVLIGRTLKRFGIGMIDDKTRFDVTHFEQQPPVDRYHVRFKTADRYQDAENMRLYHELIMSKNV